MRCSRPRGGRSTRCRSGHCPGCWAWPGTWPASRTAPPAGRRLVDRLADLRTDAERDAADRVIARDQALAALRTLSAKEVEAVTLTAWHGLAPAEAARVAGCSRAAFLVRLHRGRRRLAALDDTGARTPEPAPYPRVTTEKP